GLGDGLEDDVFGVRMLAESLPELIVVSSCSKNFGLYCERVGAVTVICQTDQQLSVVSSQLAAIARGIYSMPPDHGAAIVREILQDPDLRHSWDLELTEMRERINSLRASLAQRLRTAGVETDFSFIEREKGMFSFLGINVEQVQKLIADYSIYLVNSSRINVAGINDSNIDYLVDSLTGVLSNTRSGP
ncbi:MAG: aminotransferase class I/II-fold pyridoxal phosphate-dependent enzyme, partial [Gammaproteobacteria bacterium]|nr:aminotransferase class I/II-fold pyridoxal phosphate-dependent enzyme [Gammaproteobacteria bacterium]